MPLKNRIKKQIRVLASNSLFFQRVFKIFNLINLPRKIFYLFCLNFGLIPKLSNEKDEIIVSLTSYGHRVKKILHFTLFSLLLQSQKPDKIVVWLDENEFNSENLPKMLKKLTNFGVDVKFCKNIFSFKKLIPSLKEFPDSVIITTDDDVYYAKNWLKKLFDKHNENPKAIIGHRAHEITFTDGKMNPYLQWKQGITKTQNPQNLFFTGVGGILYPPKSLNEKVLNEELFMKLTPKADDVWFWAMAKLQKTAFEIPQKPFSNPNPIDIAEELVSGLTIENIVNNRNDEQIKAVVEYFNLNF